ncbi:MAG: phenylacetate--CoA ligase family protein [Burkholderiales bacterium]|nr:phenylacetate--CoA ligase family protein [Burkholderiales bacterium]
MRADHPVLRAGAIAFSYQPLKLLKGLFSANIAYPYAEKREQREVRPKLEELRRFYSLDKAQRRSIATNRLADALGFAGTSVPYYRDLFAQHAFNPENVRADVRYLNDLPYLTKDIIREQGDRMLSRELDQTRHHICKTGGSTGLSCVIYYDQEGADYSAAVTLYARERIGKRKYKTELHFACRFPDAAVSQWPTREDFKCFAMNRSNIFFSSVDDNGLEEIWQTLLRRRPYLAHAHPSTIYALACYVERKYGSGKAFEVFESSGELLEPYQREAISRALHCRVVDRYGLAELGVVGYELSGAGNGQQVLESEAWPESFEVDRAENGEHELVFTGFRNKLMPLIRYRTGDLAKVEDGPQGFFLTNVVGRIHDLVSINGVDHPTHHIQDMLDHRVGGIQEFQIDLRSTPPVLKIVPEVFADKEEIRRKVTSFWGQGFELQFVDHDAFVRVGRHAKFRHVVHP